LRRSFFQVHTFFTIWHNLVTMASLLWHKSPADSWGYNLTHPSSPFAPSITASSVLTPRDNFFTVLGKFRAETP
jgi:hypothetical protein